MGREANCVCDWNGAFAEVKAQLEPPDLILRGGRRCRVSFADMKRVTVTGDTLSFTLQGESILLVLGKELAPKWAKVIKTPPPSLAKKLGITAECRVMTMGRIDDDALRRALAEARTDKRGSLSLMVARVNAQTELSAAFKKAAHHLAAGVPLWIVYRKGPGHAIGESDVRSTGLAAGVVDVKVASVSQELTGLKFAVRKNSRPA